MGDGSSLYGIHDFLVVNLIILNSIKMFVIFFLSVNSDDHFLANRVVTEFHLDFYDAELCCKNDNRVSRYFTKYERILKHKLHQRYM